MSREGLDTMDKGVKMSMSDWGRQTGRDTTGVSAEGTWSVQKRTGYLTEGCQDFVGQGRTDRRVQRGCKDDWVACWIGPAKVQSSWDDLEA